MSAWLCPCGQLVPLSWKRCICGFECGESLTKAEAKRGETDAEAAQRSEAD